MTALADHGTQNDAPLAPVTAALRGTFGTDDVPGLVPGLLLPDGAGWAPAGELVGGARIPALLNTAAATWRGTPHACAALAWKFYSYWLTLPAVLGWASARRVPLLDPAHVLIRLNDHGPLLTLGLRRSTPVAVLPADPLAAAPRPEVRVVAGEADLLATMRASLLDAHLDPVIRAIQARVRLGRRTLLGSVASAVANALLRAAHVLPGPPLRNIDTLLGTLGVADLIDLVPGSDGAAVARRRTCCLAFTLPQPKYCPDCCVRPA